MSESSTDRIEKQVLLRAPRSRVWRALADADEFGEWFGVKMNGPFAPGARVTGRVTHPDYEGLKMEITIEEVVPERRLSWRWHPNAVDPARDYSGEPTTLVVFELAEAPDGTLLTVVESGFDRIPLERRAEAYRGNEEGWSLQVQRIADHVTRPDSP